MGVEKLFLIILWNNDTLQILVWCLKLVKYLESGRNTYKIHC